MLSQEFVELLIIICPSNGHGLDSFTVFHILTTNFLKVYINIHTIQCPLGCL
jgi:hypothetical protein